MIQAVSPHLVLPLAFCCFFHLTHPLVLSLYQQRPVPMWYLCPVCLITTVTSKVNGPQKGEGERNRSVPEGICVHRVFIEAIDVRRGHQSSPRKPGTASW